MLGQRLGAETVDQEHAHPVHAELEPEAIVLAGDLESGQDGGKQIGQGTRSVTGRDEHVLRMRARARGRKPVVSGAGSDQGVEGAHDVGDQFGRCGAHQRTALVELPVQPQRGEAMRETPERDREGIGLARG